MAQPGWGALHARGIDVVTVGALAPDAAEAIAAADARVLAAFDWDAVGELPHGALVIAAAAADIGQGELEALAAELDARSLPAIVVCEADALDAVAATLMGPRVELLCDATPEDWAAALAFAALATAAVPAGVREGGDEGERLRRLQEAVARIAAQLEALAEPAPAGGGWDTVRTGGPATPRRARRWTQPRSAR